MLEEGVLSRSAPLSGFFRFIEVVIETILMPSDHVPGLRPPALNHFDQCVLVFEINGFPTAVTGEFG